MKRRFAAVCTNTRARPTVRRGIHLGEKSTASPEISGLVGFGVYRERRKRPQNTCASMFPIQMSCGRDVPRNTCGNHGPAFDITIEFLRPGPSHRFSFEMPTATFHASART